MTAELADRVRAALPAGREIREVRMFGGVAFMVDGALLLSAGGDGTLLVRIDPARHEELLRRPGTRAAVMGRDRPMGPTWLTVAEENLVATAELDEWIAIATAR